MLGEAAAVVTTLKNASDLVQKLRSSTNPDELRNGVGALTEMLIDARASALDLIQEKAGLLDERAALNRQIEQLQREISKLSDFDLAAGKYERVQMRSGMYLYRESVPAGQGSAAHFCPTCFQNKKLSILQKWGEGTVKCMPCETYFDV